MAKKEIKDFEDIELPDTEDDNKIPEWEKDFDQKNLDKVAELGILPELKPQKGANYTVSIVKNPYKKSTENWGDLWVCEVMHNEVHKTMICNNSFLFSYGAMRRGAHLTERQLIGKTIKFQKKMSGMISVQLSE